MTNAMLHTWYVSFEDRRRIRFTTTFATEIEAKNFAREKSEDGLIVFAGTINSLPRQLIPSERIFEWVGA